MFPDDLDVVIATHQIYPFYTGGTEIAMKNLAEKLHELGYKVGIVTKKSPHCDVVSTEVPHKFVTTTEVPGLRQILFMLFAMFAVMKLERAKAVIFLPVTHSLPCIILKRIGYFTINWARGSDIYNPLIPTLLGTFINSTNITFALSEDIKARMEQETDRKIFRVPNGFSVPKSVKPKEIYPCDNTKPIRLVYVGRLIYYKRIDILIEAISKLKPKKHLYTLDIIGEGPEKTRIENQISELGIEDFIKVHGRIPNRIDVLKLERECDILVYPSERGQGLGNTVLEAMYLGLPVVAFNLGYFPEVIEEDKNGWLVEYSPDGEIAASRLAAKLLSIQKNLDSIREKGKNASKSIETNYTWSRVVKRMIGIINNHLNQS